MAAQAHALIVSGEGRYADPWHPFAETSARLAEVVADAGYGVEIDGSADARLADLRGIDLLVLNLGNPGEPTSADEATADSATRAGLLDYLGRGGALLAMHVASTSFPAVPEWEAVLGGIWVRGTTMHPPRGRAYVHVHPARHAIVSGLDDFELEDERYSDLRVADDVSSLAEHEHEGRMHPLLWTHRFGDARVVYDALGHDAASFQSATHRRILHRAVRWLGTIDDEALDAASAVDSAVATAAATDSIDAAERGHE